MKMSNSGRDSHIQRKNNTGARPVPVGRKENDTSTALGGRERDHSKPTLRQSVTKGPSMFEEDSRTNENQKNSNTGDRPVPVRRKGTDKSHAQGGRVKGNTTPPLRELLSKGTRIFEEDSRTGVKKNSDTGTRPVSVRRKEKDISSAQGGREKGYTKPPLRESVLDGVNSRGKDSRTNASQKYGDTCARPPAPQTRRGKETPSARGDRVKADTKPPLRESVSDGVGARGKDSRKDNVETRARPVPVRRKGKDTSSANCDGEKETLKSLHGSVSLNRTSAPVSGNEKGNSKRPLRESVSKRASMFEGHSRTDETQKYSNNAAGHVPVTRKEMDTPSAQSGKEKGNAKPLLREHDLDVVTSRGKDFRTRTDAFQKYGDTGARSPVPARRTGKETSSSRVGREKGNTKPPLRESVSDGVSARGRDSRRDKTQSYVDTSARPVLERSKGRDTSSAQCDREKETSKSLCGSVSLNGAGHYDEASRTCTNEILNNRRTGARPKTFRPCKNEEGISSRRNSSKENELGAAVYLVDRERSSQQQNPPVKRREDRENNRGRDSQKGGPTSRSKFRNRSGSRNRHSLRSHETSDGFRRSRAGSSHRSPHDSPTPNTFHFNQCVSTGRIGSEQDNRSHDMRGKTNTPAAKGHFNTQRISDSRHCLTAKRLKDLVDKEPSEIVLELSTERSGCNSLLNQPKLLPNVVRLVLEVIAKACRCTTAPSYLNKLLTSVRDSLFLTEHLQQFISLSLTRGVNASNVGVIESKPVEDMCFLFQTLLQHLPSSSPVVWVLLILLEEKIKSEDASEIPSETLQDIQKLREYAMELVTPKSAKSRKETQMIESQNLKPPDDFWRLPIIPSVYELQAGNRPFLRPNLTEGKYRDAEHYLDVQFRLLREDFVAPLRDGVAEFLENLDPTQRLQDMRLYQNVRIVRLTLIPGGLGHLIQFDTTPFQRIQWESTKRLIYGSLLCLTSDNFRSVIFAKVEKREADDLRDGFLVVKFTGGLQVDDSLTYLMAETSAYYEAYSHVLEGLQELHNSRLPLQPYIIKATSERSPPKYLSHTNSRYDLRPICKAHDVSEPPIKTDSRVNTSASERVLRSVDILRTGQWFDPAILGFDDSQLEAYQAALSNEFVLIQGPPGTGKTYVGLKIVKTLLFNFQSWCYSPIGTNRALGLCDWDFRPILIVCFTNHALDQFLEGIYQYEKEVVRVGGRTSSTILSPCSLANIRKRNREEKRTLGYLFHSQKETRRENYEVRKALEIVEMHLQFAQKGILHVLALIQHMDYRHEPYLYSDTRNASNTTIKRSSIAKWLGVYNNACQQGIRKNTLNQSNCNEDLDNEDVDRDGFIDIKGEERHLLEDNHFLRNNESFEKILAVIRSDFEFLPETRGLNREEKKKRRKLERTVELAISNPDVMTEEEVDAVEDPWDLGYAQRWRLYRFWLKRYNGRWEEELLRYRYLYEGLSNELKESNQEEDYLILKSAKVIGMTTTGAAKYRNLLQRVQPKIIVIEEAAEVLEAHIITTLSRDCEHLILIGDHQQLRPNPTVYKLAKQYNLDVSLFERMIKNDVPYSRLSLQHRMCPDVSVLMKEHFYKGLGDHESVFQYENVLGIKSNIFFLEHEVTERHVDDTKSKSNIYEAKVVVKLCHYILKQGYKPSQVTILTTYTGQLSHFRKLMDRKTFDGVHVTVVDNYQGEENDIILLSLVRSNFEGSVGYLQVSNRVCVALSRAKQGFFCIGNMKLLARKSNLWKGISATLREKKQIGPAFPLGCQNHPEVMTMVSSEADFDKIPDGGCSVPCEARLECGHSCTLLCHPFDRQHKEFKCKKKCTKKCKRKHQCQKRCHEVCKCTKEVLQTFERCQHSAMIPCHEVEEASCRERCMEVIQCGHECLNICHDGQTPCRKSSDCRERVEITLPDCGHKVQVPCCDNPTGSNASKYHRCRTNCQKVLSCNHMCPNKCGEPCAATCEVRETKTWTTCSHSDVIPCRDFATATCRKACDRHLECGHKCMKICSDACESNACNETCNNTLKCGHQCQEKCGRKCTSYCNVLVQRVMPTCSHTQEIMCSVDILDSTCEAKCSKVFPCGHGCRRKCGEECEDACRTVINVQRNDCNHRIRVICGSQQEKDKSAKPCTTIMMKLRPLCGHEVIVKCHKDPSEVRCRQRCSRKLQCGHACPKLCHEVCDTPDTKCVAETKIVHPICGHSITIACHRDPSNERCKKPCKTRLPCNHTCPNLCCQPCDIKCMKTVRKVIEKCGHDVELPCHVDQNDEKYKCKRSCRKQLECQHICQEKCGAPCTTKCKETTVKIMPVCNHPVRVPCSEDPQTKSCTEYCGKRLECGHACRNTCGQLCHKEGSTLQKDIPICNALCNATLLCGHRCQSSCKDCLGGRFHQPCQRSLAEDIKLTCGCKYTGTCSKRPAARHLSDGATDHQRIRLLTTTESCVLKVDFGEISDRIKSCRHQEDPRPGQYCDKPCDRRLPCSHPCIGLCGEPCPKLCRFCDKRMLYRIFLEFQSLDRDPRYIRLQCGHTFEVNDLENKLGSTEGTVNKPVECRPVSEPGCPTCSNPVKERRYLQHTQTHLKRVQDILKEVESIEAPIKADVENDMRELGYLQQTSLNPTIRRQLTVHKPRAVRKPYPETAWKLFVIRRCNYWQRKIEKLLATLEKDNTYEELIQCCKTQMGCLKVIKDRMEEMLDCQVPLTDQMAQDIHQEMRRVQWCEVLCEAAQAPGKTVAEAGHSGVRIRIILQRAARLLHSKTPFTSSREDEVVNLMQASRLNLTLPIHETRDDMFGRFTRAQISFEAGAWMLCPRGHTFPKPVDQFIIGCPKCN